MQRPSASKIYPKCMIRLLRPAFPIVFIWVQPLILVIVGTYRIARILMFLKLSIETVYVQSVAVSKELEYGSYTSRQTASFSIDSS